MNLKMNIAFAALIIVTAGLVGCSQRAATSQEAIEKAQTIKTVEAKSDYLVKQANAFINSQDFDEAVSIARYVLSEVDSNSQSARDILEVAKVEMQKAAKGAIDDAKKKLTTLGQ